MSYQTILNSLNLAYYKLKVWRSHFTIFKDNLDKLLVKTLAQIDQSEEFHKTNLRDFLKDTFYQDNHYINIKDKNDLVIYHGKNTDSKVGVIIETKSPSNHPEMLTFNQFNNKALQQLLFYYLQERIINKNFELTQLIVTNIYDWFIFPASLFEKLFYHDKSLVKQFNDFQEKKLTSHKTDFFYKEIADSAIEKVETELKNEVVYFNLLDYHNKQDSELVLLYKFLSPQHLLNLSFTNDSNSLDQGFYNELLHIIGLTEVKDKSKKLIQRLPLNKLYQGSLLENTITQLDTYNKLDNVLNLTDYGDNKQEQLFHTALELVITWINRILFLKLLEAQLINYNQQDNNFAFLNGDRLKSYNDLDLLFFQVLAKKDEERNRDIQEKFYHVPYLNSSLFEVTILENQTIPIGSLNFSYELPFYNTTILKDYQGKRKIGELNTLHYLFDFLSAYDFSSDTSEAIQEENKTLINASVLGLIFEKINGYQDGSFFTPGFITMYMCRETIHRAVIHKFNDIKGWHYQNIDELSNHIEDIKEANSIINNLKICDPAVGSGHFLVSALNQIIALKSYLNILLDRNGNKIKKIDYTIKVINDELIITDENNKLFTYNPKNSESQRIQETLFHEKQIIIENCLFGVDINLNSVKICRLRLWIELLKNAYYQKENSLPLTRGVNPSKLETLPNIDINIKCGNSLISRFDLEELLLSPKIKQQIADFKQAVNIYRNPQSKTHKKEAIKKIEEVKQSFKTALTGNDDDDKKLRSLQGELTLLLSQTSLFEETVKEKKAKEKKQKQLEKEIHLLTAKIDDKKNNCIYHHSFEWRFEFPEVLDNEGNFIGFDIIIGNPPYIRQEEFSAIKPFLQQKFVIYNSIADLLTYFVELAYNILKDDGIFQFIISNKFTRANYGKQMRKFLLEKTTLTHFIDFSGLSVFDEATVDSAILGYQKTNQSSSCLIYGDVKKESVRINDFSNYLREISTNFLQADLTENSWSFENPQVLKIKQKIESQGIPLKQWNISISRGILTGYNQAFVIDGKTRQDLINQDSKSAEIIKPLLRGRDIHKYYPNFQDLWLINLHNGYEVNHQKIPALKIEDYPAIKQHLDRFYPQLEKRTDKGKTPYNLRNCAYLPDFEKPKIIYKDIAQKLTFTLDTLSFYTNNTNYIIVGDFDLSYLTATLNSKLFDFYYRLISTQLGTSAVRLFTQFVDKIPIKQVTEKEEKPFQKLVIEIMKLKKENPDNDTSPLEREIDLLVYQLYGLTEKEIKLVEE
ncbi:Eco57I restriction-modification methylase domain-containing protein [Geminocystis sp. GBBB08]|uniref:type IIG restriction enzyme/methyltransferase n=1 Tax=Geminocystis sp. GBBB08 TaxID=2604140 RepID=UPI0027E32AB8|nr:TaqI-like C-terminal specificity domain-containing protein [Geminocystis sp. GBBB08]MBL1208970.1 class I SAM-dependent DNA methyltransferase [Geminocystis sp. GBBB08]